MVTRKVQFTGSSTYTISLPKEWACEHGIEAGQELALCPTADGTLVVGPENATADVTPTADVTGLADDAVARTVRALYASGHDTFELRTDAEMSAATRRAVGDAATDLPGLEITAESAQSVTCHDVIDTGEVSLERLVSRLEYTAFSTMQDATTALCRLDTALAADVTARRANAAGTLAGVERYFTRSLSNADDLAALSEPRDRLLAYYRVATQLDHVAARAADVARLATRQETRPDDAWVDAFEDVSRELRTFVESAADAALSGVTPAEARAIRGRYDDRLDAVESLPETPGAPEVAWPLRRVAACGRELGDRAVQSSLSRP